MKLESKSRLFWWHSVSKLTEFFDFQLFRSMAGKFATSAEQTTPKPNLKFNGIERTLKERSWEILHYRDTSRTGVMMKWEAMPARLSNPTTGWKYQRNNFVAVNSNFRGFLCYFWKLFFSMVTWSEAEASFISTCRLWTARYGISVIAKTTSNFYSLWNKFTQHFHLGTQACKKLTTTRRRNEKRYDCGYSFGKKFNQIFNV